MINLRIDTPPSPFVPPPPPARRLSALVIPVLLALVVVTAMIASIVGRIGQRPDAETIATTHHIALLSTDAVEVRRVAAKDLGEIRDKDLAITVPALISASRDPDVEVRRAAIDSLGRAISRAAHTRDVEVESEVADASQALVVATLDRDPEVRRAAAEALGRLRVEAVRDPQSLRVTVPAVGPAPEVAVPALLLLADDPSPNVRAAAIVAVGKIAPRTSDCPPALLSALLTESDEAVRAAAVESVAQLWRDSAKLSLTLARKANATSDPGFRASILAALFGPEYANPIGRPRPTYPREAVSDLIALLKFDEPAVRTYLPRILETLGRKIEDPATSVIPLLMPMALGELREGKPPFAARAILSLDPEGHAARSLAVPLVEADLRHDRDDAERSAFLSVARVCFSKLEPDAVRPVLPKLEASRKSPNQMVRKAATDLLEYFRLPSGSTTASAHE